MCAGYQQLALEKGTTYVPLTHPFEVILEVHARGEDEEKKTWYVAKLIDVHQGLAGVETYDTGRRTLEKGEATHEDFVAAKIMAMNALLNKTAWEAAKADKSKGKKKKAPENDGGQSD